MTDDHTFDEFSNQNSIYLTDDFSECTCVTSTVIVGATKVLDINIFVYIRRDFQPNAHTHCYNFSPLKMENLIKN